MLLQISTLKFWINLDSSDYVHLIGTARGGRSAGLYMAPNLVLSKWGVGPLFRHALWDVPKSYGDALRYFKQPDQAKVDAFIKRELPLVHLSPVELHELPA